jgi:hypothetical protein
MKLHVNLMNDINLVSVLANVFDDDGQRWRSFQQPKNSSGLVLCGLLVMAECYKIVKTFFGSRGRSLIN